METKSVVFLFFIVNLLVHARPAVIHCEGNDAIEIEENILDSTLKELVWLGKSGDSQRVSFSYSEEGTLYRSEDDGRSWKSQKEQLGEAKRIHTGGTSSYITGIFPTSADPNTIWFVSGGNDTWVTKDGGKTYSYVKLKEDLRVVKVTPHPTLSSTALSLASSLGCETGMSPCDDTLFITKDLGSSWTEIRRYVGDYFWGKEKDIWIESFKDSNDRNRWDCLLIHSKDEGETWEVVLEHVARVVLKHQTIFAAQLISQQGDLRIWSSKDFGVNDFLPAHFPVEMDQSRYTILNTRGEATFVNVEHTSAKWGNIYTSNSNNTRFSLSLERNQRDIRGRADFEQVEGMKGIYLANTFLDEFAVYHDERQTKVTFNNGGHWRQLALPETTYDGTPIVCPDECALHLHLIGKEEQDIQSIRSQINALGVIMAVGNVGRYLDTSHLRTYMSRDAGTSWREVAEGSHVYEFGDHGGIIVMAPNRQLTNSIQYSLDEGHSWKECRFSDALQVKDILGSPNNTGLNFMLQGTRHKQDKKEAVVLHLDFSGFNQRTCEESDYEEWSATSGDDRNCLLGQTISYQRRKVNATCWNGKEFERKSKAVPCLCAQEDWECDYCFEPLKGDGRVCVPVCEETINRKTSIPKDCEDYYYVSKGYRLVAGDKCEGGLDLSPEKVKCPSNPFVTSDGSGSPIMLIVILALAAIFVLLIGGMIAVSKSKHLQRMLPQRFRDSTSTTFMKLQSLDEDDFTEDPDARELEDQDIRAFNTRDSEEI